MEITEGIKKLMLAGIGAVATTYEKSEEVLNDLVKKGEITVDQGKALNTELKHTLKEGLKGKSEFDAEDFISGLSDEEMERLKSALDKKEHVE